MQRVLVCLLLAAALLGVAPPVHAQSITYSVVLDGLSESPPNASPGIGSGTVIYDPAAHTLALSVSFSGLIGTTSASHIHGPTLTPFAGTAGVATTTPSFVGFPLGVTSGSFSNTLDLTLSSSYNPSFITANGGTTASAEAALFAAMNTGRAYWNIHSGTFPGGEIRGFLAVPEPSTYLLISVGALGGLGTYQWRRWRTGQQFRRARC